MIADLTIFALVVGAVLLSGDSDPGPLVGFVLAVALIFLCIRMVSRIWKATRS